MILICDLGLSLKKQFKLSEKMADKKDFVAENSLTRPIGQGYDLARVLLAFGETSSLLGFYGGHVGDSIKNNLIDNGINSNLIMIKEKSAEHISLDFLDKTINIVDPQPKITREEIVKFYSECKEGLNLNELVCLVGDHPDNIPDDMLFNIVDLSSKWGRKMFLGVKEKTFQGAIEGVPYTLILNKNILEDITNLSLDFENEIIKACIYLFDKGIKNIIIDNNEKGLIVLDEECVYRLSLPLEYSNRNLSYGGFLGGFALSISRNYDMETLCKLSYACGLLNFENFTSDLEATDIKALMKIIDLTKYNNI